MQFWLGQESPWELKGRLFVLALSHAISCKEIYNDCNCYSML